MISLQGRPDQFELQPSRRLFMGLAGRRLAPGAGYTKGGQPPPFMSIIHLFLLYFFSIELVLHCISASNASLFFFIVSFVIVSCRIVVPADVVLMILSFVLLEYLS